MKSALKLPSPLRLSEMPSAHCPVTVIGAANSGATSVSGLAWAPELSEESLGPLASPTSDACETADGSDSYALAGDGGTIQVVETANITALPNIINRESFISSLT